METYKINKFIGKTEVEILTGKYIGTKIIAANKYWNAIINGDKAIMGHVVEIEAESANQAVSLVDVLYVVFGAPFYQKGDK